MLLEHTFFFMTFDDRLDYTIIATEAIRCLQASGLILSFNFSEIH